MGVYKRQFTVSVVTLEGKLRAGTSKTKKIQVRLDEVALFRMLHCVRNFLSSKVDSVLCGRKLQRVHCLQKYIQSVQCIKQNGEDNWAQ